MLGRRIKSLLYSTNIALIKNCDADAVFCVYPFTAQRSISSAIIASGGRNGQSIVDTIATGANAIVYSPPNSSELTRRVMDGYRSR